MHPKDADGMADSVDPDQTAPLRSNPIWVCTVCSDLYVPICRVGGRLVRWSWVNFQCRGILQYQEPIGLAVGAGGGCLDIFISLLFLPLSGR